MNDEIKYRFLWRAGNFIALMIYYSGLAYFYTLVRKYIFHHYHTIVLTYHRIRDDELNGGISVTTKNFDRQIAHLKNKFDVVSVFDAIKNFNQVHNRKADQVAISFDDGYKDNYQNAFPILTHHNCPATIFLVTDMIGQSLEMLSREEIEDMITRGVEFGSHTVNHFILSELTDDDVCTEIDQSKKDLERILCSRVQLFAYPKGKKKHYNGSAKIFLRKCGYKAALTTENGTLEQSENIFELKRIGIRECPFYVFKVRLSGILECKLSIKLRQLLNIT